MKIDYDDIFKHVRSIETVKLTKTQPVKAFEVEEIREVLTKMYNDPDIHMRRLATWICAKFTQQIQTSMTSKLGLEDLIKNDTNSDLNSLNTSNYKDLLNRVLDSGEFIIRLRQPTMRKAGVYKLVQPTLVKLLYMLHGKEYYAAQERKALELYDNAEDKMTKEEIKDVRKQKRKEWHEKNGKEDILG